jgi:hypothetical protein
VEFLRFEVELGWIFHPIFNLPSAVGEFLHHQHQIVRGFGETPLLEGLGLLATLLTLIIVNLLCLEMSFEATLEANVHKIKLKIQKCIVSGRLNKTARAFHDCFHLPYKQSVYDALVVFEVVGVCCLCIFGLKWLDSGLRFTFLLQHIAQMNEKLVRIMLLSYAESALKQGTEIFDIDAWISCLKGASGYSMHDGMANHLLFAIVVKPR